MPRQHGMPIRICLNEPWVGCFDVLMPKKNMCVAGGRIHGYITLMVTCCAAQSLWDLMPPLVAQLLSLVVWGSQNSWFGLSCPAHCNSSLILHLAGFTSGFSSGVVSALIALWFFGIIPLDFRDRPSNTRRPPSLRLLSYLHERSAR